MSWQPGDPLYLHPDNVTHGQEARKLFELIDDHECGCEAIGEWYPLTAVAATWTAKKGWDT